MIHSPEEAACHTEGKTVSLLHMRPTQAHLDIHHPDQPIPLSRHHQGVDITENNYRLGRAIISMDIWQNPILRILQTTTLQTDKTLPSNRSTQQHMKTPLNSKRQFSWKQQVKSTI